MNENERLKEFNQKKKMLILEMKINDWLSVQVEEYMVGQKSWRESPVDIIPGGGGIAFNGSSIGWLRDGDSDVMKSKLKFDEDELTSLQTLNTMFHRRFLVAEQKLVNLIKVQALGS
jgi:hypothetical protein